MQFSSFSRSVDGLTITLYNEVPVESVGSIKYYSDNSSGTFSKKEFRWSFNNVYWASWQPLTQINISRINMQGNYYLFLEIRYILSAASSGDVTTFTINYVKSTATSTSTGVLAQDIQDQDSSAVLIHDILQSYEIVSIVDACTLSGYSGSWYLNRSHHTGYQTISTITGLQSILNQLIANQGYSQEYIDASLNARVKEASLGSDFVWINGLLDVSILSGYSQEYVDGSLNARIKEASLGTDFVWNNGLLDVSIAATDLSVNDLYNYVYDLSTHTSYWKEYVDSSLALRLPEASLGPNFTWSAGYLSLVDNDLIITSSENTIKIYSDASYFYIDVSIIGFETKGSASEGIPNQISYDASYLYICTSTNTWGRILLDTSF